MRRWGAVLIGACALVLGGGQAPRPVLRGGVAVSANGNPDRFIDPAISGIDLSQREGQAPTTVSPGVQAAFARFLVSLEKDAPDYSGLTLDEATVMRGRWSELRAMMTDWGLLQALEFERRDADGANVFRVTYQRAEVEWTVSALTNTGRISSLSFDPKLTASQAAAPLSGVTVAVPRRPQMDGLTVGLPRRCIVPHRRPEPDIPAPRVVSTYPASGQVVKPGLLIVRVTFDLPMACSGQLADDKPYRNPCPGAVQEALLSLDRKTFWTVCPVQGGTRYGLKFNGSGDDAHSYVSLAGKRVEPFELTFSTSDDVPMDTLKAAIDQDAETVAYIAAAQQNTTKK